MRRPLMMMRSRGLLGTLFGRFSGSNVLSKSVGAFHDIAAGAANIVREILQLNGTGSFLLFNAPQSLSLGDTLTFDFATLSSGTLRSVVGTAGGSIVDFDVGDLVQLTNFTLTIDSASVSDGASISAYQDGIVHRYILTATEDVSVTHLMQSGLGSAYMSGHVLDVLTEISGTSTRWILDSGSIVLEYPNGESSGSNYIAYANVGVDDWADYRYSSAEARWDWLDKAEAGSAFLELQRSLTTPLNLTINPVLAQWDVNWEGLYHEVNTGFASYLYSSAANEPLSLYFAAPEVCTSISLSSLQLLGEVPDLSLFTAFSSWDLGNNLFSTYSSRIVPSSVSVIFINANNLTQGAVDRVLADARTSVELNSRTGYLTLVGNTAPSAAGAADAQWLRDNVDAWTVLHD